MIPKEMDNMFNCLTFGKSSSEILAKVEEKIATLKAKIEERKDRVAGVREAHLIDDAAWASILEQARRQDKARQFTYSSVANATVGGGQTSMEERTIAAGTVNDLLTENDFIQSERASVKRLNLFKRNLRPYRGISQNGNPYDWDQFTLSEEDLEFLGF